MTDLGLFIVCTCKGGGYSSTVRFPFSPLAYKPHITAILVTASRNQYHAPPFRTSSAGASNHSWYATLCLPAETGRSSSWRIRDYGVLLMNELQMGIQSELHTLAQRNHCFQRTASPVQAVTPSWTEYGNS